MEASTSQRPVEHAHDIGPVGVCDLILDAAIASDVDTIWIEPRPPAEDHYDVTLERRGAAVAVASLDATVGASLVARLALLAEVDLLARRPTTGRAMVRGPGASAEIVVTIRPGRSLRAEVFVRKVVRAVTPGCGTSIDLDVGSIVGNYRVTAHLGAGGMGRVLQVEHTTLARSHALKVLHASVVSADPEGPARFLREARAAARIRHPNIVDVFDFGYLADGRPYLVMELLDGASLTELIADGPIEPRVVVTVARQLASALAAAHQVGVIHADVSPSNVLVADDHLTKLVDFGLALLRGDSTRLTTDEPTEFVFGTPSYISPEQIRGQGADERSDQYSLGVVMFEMLTGTPPFHGRTIRDLCMKHIKSPVPEPTTAFGPLPAELTRAIQRCMAKRPEDRFPSMHELGGALAEADQAMSARGWRRWLDP